MKIHHLTGDFHGELFLKAKVERMPSPGATFFGMATGFVSDYAGFFLVAIFWAVLFHLPGGAFAGREGGDGRNACDCVRLRRRRPLCMAAA